MRKAVVPKCTEAHTTYTVRTTHCILQLVRSAVVLHVTEVCATHTLHNTVCSMSYMYSILKLTRKAVVPKCTEADMNRIVHTTYYTLQPMRRAAVPTFTEVHTSRTLHTPHDTLQYEVWARHTTHNSWWGSLLCWSLLTCGLLAVCWSVLERRVRSIGSVLKFLPKHLRWTGARPILRSEKKKRSFICLAGTIVDVSVWNSTKASVTS